MPSTPVSKKCNILGCRNQKTDRSAFCVEHGGGPTEKQKANAKLYNSAAWKAKRAQQRSLHPLCARCLANGKVVNTEHIDHVFPHRRDGERFMNNLFQGLCTSCHTLKTNAETKGVIQHWTPHGLVEYVNSDHGYVLLNENKNSDLPAAQKK